MRYIDEDAENRADATFWRLGWRFGQLPASNKLQQHPHRLPRPPKPHDEIDCFFKFPTRTPSNGPSTPQQLKTDFAKTTTGSSDGKLQIRAEGALFMAEGAAALYVHLSGDSFAL